MKEPSPPEESLAKCLQQPGLNQAEARSQDFSLVCVIRHSLSWHLLPVHINRKLQLEAELASNMECKYLKALCVSNQ